MENKLFAPWHFQAIDQAHEFGFGSCAVSEMQVQEPCLSSQVAFSHRNLLYDLLKTSAH